MLERALQSALAAAREAGAAVRGYYNDEYTVRDKGQDNPLTDADLASNQILIDRLTTDFPDFGMLSEETVDTPERLDKQAVWIIDPVDGTREFTLGIPEFVVSVGLVVDGIARVGVLYNPIRDQLFAGILPDGGSGRATLNGEPIHVSSHSGLRGARLVCSRSEMKKGWFEPYIAHGVTPEPVGSVAYKFGLVAAGMAEATFTPQPRSEWDIAGGVAIVHAAGGRTSEKTGASYVFNKRKPLVDGILATNGRVHADLRVLMGQQG